MHGRGGGGRRVISRFDILIVVAVGYSNGIVYGSLDLHLTPYSFGLQLAVSMPYPLPSLDIYGFMHHGRIKIPYPLQWGAPLFSSGHPFGMMAVVLVSMIESTGAFKAASRLASATPPPARVLSRGNWDPFQWTFWDNYRIYSFCVSLWDGIIPSKEHAKFSIHTTNKYRFTDQGSNLQGKKFNLTLHWHVMPKTGKMFADKIVMSGFSLPVEYR
ncbi:hypothetical protein TEA_004677 [Camellia sinensis var. sinensis]|uniref:Signal peptidase complex subunit 3 n=1 Tax=Camellia sinensis var. sinensis TaxID=542762 RepID=A0A4S4DNM3_CAMSN|nr:hypothetical protein TEA_004677 [Camellia sinensis var. sinensis]